jgi:hypothetical protein
MREPFVADHRRVSDGGIHVRDQMRAQRRRIARLADLTEPQRRLIVALLHAAKAAA